VRYSLLVAGVPSFCQNETVPRCPSGSGNPRRRTGGTSWTAVPREGPPSAAGTRPPEPGSKSGTIPGLPRNRSRSIWKRESAFCAGPSRAPLLVEGSGRPSASVCERRRSSHALRSQMTPCLRWAVSLRPGPNTAAASWMLAAGWGGEFHLVTVVFPGSAPRSCSAPFLPSPGQPRQNNHLPHVGINYPKP